MITRDKIIKEVAQEQGVPKKKVEILVRSQAEFIKMCMREKKEVSIYLYKVGTFTPKSIWRKIKKAKMERLREKIKNRENNNNKKDTQDPYEFN